MYQFYNAHPKGLFVGDCVKRAIVKSTGMDYMEVQRALNRYKKVTGAAKFNSHRNCDKYVEEVLHGIRISFPAQKGKPRMNGERFCKAYPSGSYILNMAGHWSCCVDGIIYDTFDCSEKCVYSCYKMERVDAGYTYKINKVDPDTYSVELLFNGERVKLTSVNLKDMDGYLKCLEDLGYRRFGNYGNE